MLDLVFRYSANRLTEKKKNVSEMTYFVSGWTKNINAISQPINLSTKHMKHCKEECFVPVYDLSLYVGLTHASDRHAAGEFGVCGCARMRGGVLLGGNACPTSNQTVLQFDGGSSRSRSGNWRLVATSVHTQSH